MTRRLFLIASVVLFSAVTAQADRFTVDQLGSETDYQRIMAKKGTTILTTTLRDAGDTSETPIVYNGTTKKAKDDNKVSAVLASSVTFDGTPNKTVDVNLAFGKVGQFSSISFDIGSAAKAITLKPAVKTDPNAAAIFKYYVNSLEQRKLKVTNSTMKLGNVLRGANIAAMTGGYEAITKNKLPDSATNVVVATGGVIASSSLNSLTIHETAISGDTTSNNIAVTGRLSQYESKLKVKNVMLGVVSSEAGTGGDPEGYKSLKVAYSANVGIASKIQKKPTSATDFGVEGKVTKLSAIVNDGEQMGAYHYDVDGSETGVVGKFVSDYSLSSKVAKSDSVGLGMGADTMPMGDVSQFKKNEKNKWVKSNFKTLFGIVGSEAEIVASTARSGVGNGEISMQWRARTYDESFNPKGSQILPTLTPGPKWLTSDVVKISGTNANDVYALQMTFDNRINLALDGDQEGQLDKEWKMMYIAQLDDATSKWEKTVAATGHYESLASFLEANSDKTLDELEGAWGVDPTLDAQGRGKSWAIVSGGGSGIFAVVPEPATVVLMLSAALGAIAFGWRRMSRKSAETVA